MTDRGRKAHKVTMVWISLTEKDLTSKVKVVDSLQRKKGFERAEKASEKMIEEETSQKKLSIEPEAKTTLIPQNSTISAPTKKELLTKSRFFAKNLVWSGEPLDQRTLQGKTNKDEDVVVLHLKDFKEQADQLSLLATEDIHYWLMNIPKRELILIFVVPKEPVLDFTNEFKEITRLLSFSNIDGIEQLRNLVSGWLTELKKKPEPSVETPITKKEQPTIPVEISDQPPLEPAQNSREDQTPEVASGAEQAQTPADAQNDKTVKEITTKEEPSTPLKDEQELQPESKKEKMKTEESNGQEEQDPAQTIEQQQPEDAAITPTQSDVDLDHAASPSDLEAAMLAADPKEDAPVNLMQDDTAEMADLDTASVPEKKGKQRQQKQAKEPSVFVFYDWVRDLRAASENVVKLLFLFAKMYKAIRQRGPWIEEGRPKNHEHKQMKPIPESDYDSKLAAVLREALKEKLDNNAPFTRIDFKTYFGWYSFKDIPDVLELDSQILDLFLQNSDCRGALIYSMEPPTFVDEIWLTKELAQEGRAVAYTDTMNEYLDYFIRSTDDCALFIEYLIESPKFSGFKKLSSDDIKKMAHLLVDMVAEFRKGIMKIFTPKTKTYNEDFYYTVLDYLKEHSASPSMFAIICDRVFSDSNAQLKNQFIRHVLLRDYKVIETELYTMALADSGIDPKDRKFLMLDFIKDRSIRNNEKFLNLINRGFQTGDHIELFLETLNQVVKAGHPDKKLTPKSENTDMFLRYCLKILGPEFNQIVSRFLKCLVQAQQEKQPPQELLDRLEDKPSLIHDCLKTMRLCVDHLLPNNKLKIDLIIDKNISLDNHSRLFKDLFSHRFDTLFRDAVRNVEEVKRTFESYKTLLNSNTAFLKQYDFYQEALRWLGRLEEGLGNMTIADLQADTTYKSLKVLSNECWKKLNPFRDMESTRKELNDLAATSKSIVDFTSRLETYTSSTKRKFESFTEPSVYTYQQSLTYFRRANKPGDYAQFERFLKDMGITPSKVTTILDHSCSFAALRKILKLANSIAAIRDMECIKRESSPIVDQMIAIFNKFKTAKPETILLKDLIASDAQRITASPLFRNLPDCLLHISKSPQALKFIQSKDDQLIRSMRDDCGSEDTDIVNKLEAINRSLKPITIVEKMQSIDKVLQVVSNLNKAQKVEISQWIDEVDKAAKHLEYVFEKAQKGSQFQKAQVLGIMTNSNIKVQYNPKMNCFEASAVFKTSQDLAAPASTENQETISADEFAELFNLIKILVSDSSDKPEDDPQKDHAKLQDFSKLGDIIKKLLAQVEWMRSCGLINTVFTDPVKRKINYLLDGPKASFADQGKVLSFQFSHKENSLKHLTNLVANLEEVQTQIAQSVTQDVREWSLFSNYSGRKLHYLTSLLRGEVSSKDDKQQILNMITDTIDLPEKDLAPLRQQEGHPEIQDDAQLQLESVHRFMARFTERLWKDIDVNASKKTPMLKTCRSVIKIASTKTTPTRSGQSLKLEQAQDINEFEAIFKLLFEADQPMVSLSQVFYCSSELNLFDLVAFLQRALRDPLQRYYFVINADAMTEEIFGEFLHHAEDIQRNNAPNRNLLVFMDDEKRLEKLEQMEAFTLCTEDLSALIQKVERRSIVEKFADVFKKNQIVHSASAGMGKTKYISEKADGSSLVDVFLAGEINEHTVTTRVGSVVEQIRAAKDLVVCLKLDFIEDFQSHARLVDFILFYTCFLCKIPTEKGCYPFGDKLKKIYIELGNTFVNTLLEKSAILRIMCWEECEEVLRPWKMVYHVAEFRIEDLKYDPNPASEQQRAMKALKIAHNQINRDDTIERVAVVSQSDFRSLVREYFIRIHCKKDINEVTYAQFTYWIKILSNLGSEVDQIKELMPNALDASQKDIRVELFKEIVFEASHLSNFTVKQAKSSQDEMKKIIAKMQSNDQTVVDAQKYKERFKTLEPWDCRHFILPMLNPAKQKFMLAVYEASIFNNDDDEFRRAQRRCTKNLVEKNKWYSENVEGRKQERHFIYARMFAEHYLGEKQADFLARIEEYTLTGDNFMKICLMVQKAKMKQPIIIMGESGCGKTELVKFTANSLLSQTLKSMTLYSGLPESDLLTFIEDCVDIANGLEDEDLWVFFDEFNTTSLQTLICEIMLDRKCTIGSTVIKTIPHNIVFVAACNPYRLKIKQTDFGLVPKMAETILSHRVYPIPERVMNYIWDFGQLSTPDERRYINRMVKNAKIFPVNEDANMQNFSDAVFTVHTFVREIEERSGVSLRDIKRVIKLFAWFKAKLLLALQKLPLDEAERKELTDKKIYVKSMILSIMVAYGLRLNGRTAEQNTMLQKLEQFVNKNTMLSQKKYKAADFHNEISDFVDKYCFRELYNIPGIIPVDIAPNRPLKENFLSMLIAFDTQIPLIICGAPGTSKTLCTQILVAALNPEYRSNNHMPFFSSFNTMYSLYYGGSETSTSEGIKKVFHRAEQYLQKIDKQNTKKETPTIIFDEIGLAELSKHNPLKVLHPLLEHPEKGISFIGMSNWTLDLSKMNRLIFVSRPELTLDDLKSIFKKITESFQANTTGLADITTYLDVLAETYIRYIDWQKKYGDHRHFHGSRDMYAVSKFILHRIQGKADIPIADVQDFIKIAIERNFNGTAYLFEADKTSAQSIPISSVPGLETEKQEDKLESIKFSDLNSLQSIDDFLIGKELSHKKKAVQLTSAGVFKRFYQDELQKKKLSQLVDRATFLQDTKTVELIEQNIKEHNCRFLMLRSEGDLVDTVILARLKKIYKDDPHYKNKIIDWRGVENQDNQIELLSTLKSYVSLGYIVVMKNLDALYGSLYDLFNQKYMRMGEQQMCFLYYGESKQKVVVHDKFKCVVIQNSLTQATKEDIERKQPAPFLNRFEKFFVRISSLLDAVHIKSLIALRLKSLELTNNNNNSIVGLSIDLITSICLELENLVTADGSFDYETVDLKSIGEIKVPTEQIVRFLQLCTTDILLNKAKLTTRQMSAINRAHSIMSLRGLLQDFEKTAHRQLCVFTFSYPEKFAELEHDLRSEFLQHYRITEGEDLYRMSLQKRLNYVKDLQGHVILLIKDSSQVEFLAQLKLALNENKLLGRVIILVHLERDLSKGSFFKTSSGFSGIDYWNGWDNLLIDELEGTPYKELSTIVDYPLAGLVGLDELEDDEDEGDDQQKTEASTEIKVGTAIFLSTIKTGLQELSHSSLDVELKSHIGQLEALFKSEDHQYLVRALKKALPATNEELHKQTCGDILREKSQRSSHCLNIARELESSFKVIAKKTIEQALLSLNCHLGSLTSYAKVIMDGKIDQYLRIKYSNELKDQIGTWKVESEVHQPSVNLEVPFLRERQYKKIAEKIDQVLSEEFTNKMKGLIKDEFNAYLDQSGSNNSKWETSIANGQNLLLDMIKKETNELTDELFNQLADYNVDREDRNLTKMVLYDILKLVFFKKEEMSVKFLSSAAMFDNFHQLLLILCKEGRREPEFKTLLSTGVYLLARSKLNKNDLNLLAESLDMTRGAALSELEEARQQAGDLNIPIKTHLLVHLVSENDLEASFSAGTGNLALLSLKLSERSQSSFSDLVHFVLLLEAPFGDLFKEKASKVKESAASERKRLGRKFYLQEVRRGISSAMESATLPGHKKNSEDHPTAEERRRAVAFLCQYFYISARDFDLAFFESARADALFDSMRAEEVERVCNSVVSAFLDCLETDILRALKNEYLFTELLCKESLDTSVLGSLAESLTSLGQVRRPRVEVLICILVDRLTVASQAQGGCSATNDEGLELLNVAVQGLNWSKGFFHLSNLLCIVLIRTAFSPKFFRQLNQGYTHRAALNDILKRCPPPDQLVSRADSYLVVYFLQCLVLYSNQSDISKWTMFNCVVDYNLHFKEAKAKKITIMDEEGVNFHNKLSSAVDSEFFSAQPTGAVLQLLQSQDATKLGNDYCKYIVACLFINRFINTESAEERRNLKLIEDSARRTIESLPFDELEKKMFRTIIEGNAFDYQRFMEEGENDQEFGELLKKLFYQHYAMVVCFRGKLGYNLAAYNQPGTTLSTEGFKANVMANADMENICGLLNQTITVRLGQLGFRPGQLVNGNLGMYRCSCGFFYGLADCGFAAVTYACPRCRQPIGGTGHRHVQREGHIHIQTFAELSAMITQIYERAPRSYNPHRIMIGSDPVLSPLKLREVPIMDLVNNSQNEVYGKNLGIKMLYRHLFDHFFLVTMQETLSPQARINFNTAARQCINIQREDLRQMANRRIETLEQYFLAHIKNNIEVLRRDLSLRNTKEIFDWLRAAYSRSAYRISRSPQVSGETIQPENEKMLNPQRLLTDEQELSQKQNSSDIQGAKGIVMMLLNKRIPNNLLNKLEDKEKNINFSQLYSVMRHNHQDKTEILTKFEEAVKSSPFKLASGLVTYEMLLKKYANIIMGIYGIVRLIARKYHRAFTLEESKNKTLADLKDDDVVAEFKKFENVWKKIIPEFSETHSEIFNFNFMCNQNFDPSIITAEILEKQLNTPVYRFLMIDRADDDTDASTYMNAVVSTLVNNVHNKLIDEAYRVLGVDPAAIAKDEQSSLKLEYCNSSNLIGPVDFGSIVLKSYYFHTDPDKENQMVFDMPTIEAECSKKVIKQKILVDGNYLSYYSFKYSKKTENLKYLNILKTKFKDIGLPESLKTELGRLSESDKKAVKDFALELAEPIQLQNLEGNPSLKAHKLPEYSKVYKPARLRLDELAISQIPALYDYLEELDLSSKLIAPLTPDQDKAIRLVDIDRLESLYSEIEASYRAYPDKQEILKTMSVSDYGIEVDDLPKDLQDIVYGNLSAIRKAIQERRTMTASSSMSNKPTVKKPADREMDSSRM
jgi:hypothetical protein